ncbi:MAG: hypothetical protein DRQ55_12295 [Planctomycetota bacterium]|nr:MAG: hypothetical protein DRQ55_12295 [Planctomycetota bacterium]
MVALSHQRSRQLVLLAFGFTALCAQLSFWVQAQGLIGSTGILPLAQRMAAIEALPQPPDALEFPTLLRLLPSDLGLHLLCALGVCAALLVLLDVAPALGALLLALVTLSQVLVSDAFLSFQWDSLMVEVSLAMALYAPWRLWRDRRGDPEPPAAARWLLWWILLRLMLESGLVKLSWSDATWADLSAMSYHHQTQPLPHGVSAAVHALPARAHELEALAMFGVELALPLLIVCGRWGRRLALPGLLGLQLVIAATGNYGFFNLLTAVLCLALLDDRVLRLREPPRRRASWWQRGTALALLLVSLAAGTPGLLRSAAGPGDDPRTLRVGRGDEHGWAATLQRRARTLLSGPLTPLEPLRQRLQRVMLVNDYGLFRSMTTTRPEILLELSDDGERWTPWPFRHKPGDPARRPAWCQPHMPRLDWRLWFEALRWEWFVSRGYAYESSPWFGATLRALVQERQGALALMGTQPLGAGPPSFLRATLVEARYATPDERRVDGGWWHHEPLDDVGLVLSP